MADKRAEVASVLLVGAMLGIGSLFLVAGISLHVTSSVLRIEIVRVK